MLSCCGCQSIGCKKLSAINGNNLYIISDISLFDLSLYFGSKNSKMSDLCFKIFDRTLNDKLIFTKSYRLSKMMMGGIKRSTQPKTQRNMIMSSSFNRSRLIFKLIDNDRYKLYFSIGIRRDNDSKYLPKPSNQKHDDMWYHNWCTHGIIEEQINQEQKQGINEDDEKQKGIGYITKTTNHRISPLIILHDNKLIGNMYENLKRLDLIIYSNIKYDDIDCDLDIFINDKNINEYLQISDEKKRAEVIQIIIIRKKIKETQLNRITILLILNKNNNNNKRCQLWII